MKHTITCFACTASVTATVVNDDTVVVDYNVPLWTQKCSHSGADTPLLCPNMRAVVRLLGGPGAKLVLADCHPGT